MNKFLSMGAVLALVAACDQRPVPGDTDPEPDQEPVGEQPVVGNRQVAVGDLLAANFDPDATNPLVVRVALDGGNEELQAYLLYPDGDENGFTGYSFQDRPDSRFFRALGGESADGSVNAVVVSDGGQFNRFFGGAVVNQITYTAPDGGQQYYRGGYVGLLNFGPTVDEGPAGTASGNPRRSFAVTGDAFMISDFTEGATNGEIFNRAIQGALVDEENGVIVVGGDGDTVDLQPIVMVVGRIADNGSFTGSVETLDQDGLGSYGGLFGGTNASAVAGVVRLGEGFLKIEIEDPENPGEFITIDLGDGKEIENGVFILELDVLP